jgi:phosphate transport system permease protein
MSNTSNTFSSLYTKTSNSKWDQPMDLGKRRRWNETIIQAILFFCGALSIFTTVGIVYGLAKESLTFFTRTQWEETNKILVAPINSDIVKFELSTGGGSLQIYDFIRINEEIMIITGIEENKVAVMRGAQNTVPVSHSADTDVFQGIRVTLLEFFSSTRWNPQIGQFGIWPLVTATLMTSLSAMIVALPIGLSVAIYLSEYASDRSRSVLKPILEILAGIPTVVMGYFALTFMTPLLRSILGKDVVEIYNTASAGIVIGILIFPYVSSMSEDALHAVPRSLREASYALGSTKLETAIWVVVPAAISGITAAFIVAISRAIGETMIVAIAAGAGPNFTFNPFMPAETMTGHIVRISGGDISYDSIDYNSIFAIGLMLFFITLALNVISRRIVRRFHEVYE